MITKDEIMKFAGETGLRPNIVEKDYVLGWLLAGIHANTTLTDIWVFKGGTCLKKCYFETYRFSEDLDFTLRDGAHLDETFLSAQFSIVSEWIYEACGIEIPADRLKFDVHKNPRGHTSCEGRVYYQSLFIPGKKNSPKIKLDLTANEVLVLPPSRQAVAHPYSDKPSGGIQVNCYSYPEVFAEKVRALGERGRPRDLYDVINLYRNDDQQAPIIQDVLEQKCTYKKIAVPSLEQMGGYKESLLQNWGPMLEHQLPALPAFDSYWDALPDFFTWLSDRGEPLRIQRETISSSDQVYRPAYGQIRLPGRSSGPIEIIRFAAGNRLCVELDYTDTKGKRTSRIIEPYSLRRAQNGNILLYAVRTQNGKIRAYRVNRINGASLTDQVFEPRYQIELSPAVDPSAPPYTG